MSRNSTPRVARSQARALLRRLRREEDGQTLLLGVELIYIALALLFVAASVTAVYLDLKTLAPLADSAMTAGTDNVEAHPHYEGGVTDDAPGPLTDVGVGNKTVEGLSAQPTTARLEGVTVVSTRTADSRTVEVKLQARSRPPFLPRGILPAGGFIITATGSARMTTTQ